LVEDQVLFAQMLGFLLAAGRMVDVVASAHTVQEGIEACRQHRPDILLLDLALPDGDGLAVARALVQCSPHARIIIISGEADTFRCPAGLRQQVYSVIDKTRTFAVVCQELAGCLGQMFPDAPVTKKGDASLLSPREAEVFRLLGLGLSTKEIAAAAFISPQTVATHRKRIAAKLGLSSSALIRRAALHELASTAKKGA
jgi:DNA-binding NarL/FixJ family response regulator